jgi:predicted secreted protein
MSDAVSGVGTLFRRWNATTGVWAEIAEINIVTGPTMSRDTIDVTTLGSTGGYREFIAGFRDGGTVVLSMNFTRAQFDTMKDDFESDTLVNYEVVLPDASTTTLEFEGLVTELPLTVPPDDKITMDVTIKISGEVTVNSGSASASPG